jgi:arginase family enzyme
MPEPDGLKLDEVEALFAELSDRTAVLGAGLTGLAPAEENVPRLHRLVGALGL